MPDGPVTADGRSDGIEVLVNPGDGEDCPVALIEEAVRAVLADAGVASAELSITLLDDESIRALNARYLERDRPTDVIAFSLGTPDEVLGDVYLGVDQAARQAEEYGEVLDHELARLAIHGTLHVLGHDHPEGAERADSPMFALQERILARVLDRG